MMPFQTFAADEPFYQTAIRAWPQWLPLLAGAASVYLLLPRPRPYPAWSGAAAGVLALALGGVFLLKPLGLSPEAVLFYCFAALAVASGGLLATQSNPARAALSFTLVVLSTCGLFLLLAAPFLFAATIIVYAGAIIVTFLFVIMLAQQEGFNDADSRSREPGLAVVTGFLLLGVVLHVVRLGHDTRRLDELLLRAEAFKANGKTLNSGDSSDPSVATAEEMRRLGYLDLVARAEAVEEFGFDLDLKEKAGKVMDRVRDILHEAKARQGMARPGKPLSGLSGTPANSPDAERRRDPRTGVPEMPAENAAALGKSLFTDYLLPVELGGFLLLAATVGAIAIAQRKPAHDLPGGTR